MVLAKLGFPKPLDYDVKPDGSLAVVDSNGQKYVLPKKDWEGLIGGEQKGPQVAERMQKLWNFGSPKYQSAVRKVKVAPR